MSVLDIIQSEEEKARKNKAAMLEENRVKLNQVQNDARAEAAQIIANARRQAGEILDETKKRLAEQRQDILRSAASRDAQEAETARVHLPEAAARIVERIEQQ